MATQAQKIRLAIFVLFASGVLILLLLLIAGLHVLEEPDTYTIEFQSASLSGLTRGSSVKYKGIFVGQVDDLYISPDKVGTAVVKLALNRETIGRSIRTDTKATLSHLGVTGLKYVELIPGSQEAEWLPPGSQIQAADTFFGNLEERTTRLLFEVDEVLKNLSDITDQDNRIQVSRILKASADLLENSNDMLEHNQTLVDTAARQLVSIGHSLVSASAALQATADSLNQLVTEGRVRRTMTNLETISGQIKQQMEGPLPDLIANMNKMSISMDRTFTHIDLTVVQGRENILDAMQDLEEALQNVLEVTELIREDPSVLIRGTERE